MSSLRTAVYDLAASGASQRAIARSLGCARSTVQHHLKRMPAEVGSDAVQSWIVLPDPHVPKHDKRTMAAVTRYISDNHWDGWLCLGDLNDFDAVSHWNKTALRKAHGKTVANQYRASNKWLDDAEWSVRERNPDCEMILLEGNHDFWIERYIDEHPAMEGSLEVPIKLNLDERNIAWVQSWSKGDVFRKGHASFVHGRYINTYHARKHAEMYGTNIFYGHTHDMQCYSYERLGDDATYVGQSLGCLQEYDAEYLRGGPTRWQQGFGVFYFFPGGYFTYYVVRVFEHSFVAPNGKLYRG